MSGTGRSGKKSGKGKESDGTARGRRSGNGRGKGSGTETRTATAGPENERETGTGRGRKALTGAPIAVDQGKNKLMDFCANNVTKQSANVNITTPCSDRKHLLA